MPTESIRKHLARTSVPAARRLAAKSPLAIGLLSLLSISMLSLNTIHAAPLPQPTQLQVQIDNITLRDDLALGGRVRTTFDRGARLIAAVDVTDLRDEGSVPESDPDYGLQYTLDFEIRDVRTGTIYDSSQDPGDSRQITLAPSESGSVELVWNIPYDFPSNDYIFRVNIDLADVSNTEAHFSEQNIRIMDSSRHIFKEEDRWNFRNVVDEETPRTKRILISPNNPDAGDLVWRVTGWPFEWLELIEPMPDPLDPSRSIEVTNTGFLQLRVSSSALVGNFSDEVIITFNAGEVSFPVLANINRHPGGEIDRFDVTPNQVKAGEDVQFNYRVNNNGRTDLSYRVTFVVRGPSNAVVYDSSVSDEDAFVEVADGQTTDTRQFAWKVPYGSVKGDYRVGIELRNAYEFDARPYDAIDTTDTKAKVFNVLEGAKISVSPSEWQFGSISEQDIERQTATFNVTNVGRPTLEWQITAVPEWIELINLSPQTQQTGDGIVVLRLREDIAPGNYLDIFKIDSNGGEFEAALGVNIRSSVRPTPTRSSTHTPVPTPTSEPTAEPTSTPIVEPESTDTPVPTPTATSAPAPEPTSTPIPEPTPADTPTPEPTVTNTPVPEPTATPVVEPASTATPTPEPTATNTPIAEAETPDTPIPVPTSLQPGVSDKPPGGACSEAPQPLSPVTALANIAMLLAPIGLAGGARWTVRRHKINGR
ncbi:MAG: hypothetical protein F4X34_07925 [Chloroflexi bacterium]|nr:hypothetical protein [Chloroflexota bacterium]